MFGLVKADPPPERPKGPKLAEAVRPLLEQILVEADRDWWRLAVYPSPQGAGNAVSRLTKRFGATEWEWKAAKIEDVSQSAVYVRWVGTTGGLL